MLYTIAIIQICTFLFFFTIERCFPRRNFPLPPAFTWWWMALGIFALIWLRLVFYVWLQLPTRGFELPGPLALQGFIFYLFYSFGNYWFHRWKHSNSWLWRYIHKFHHSTSHMESRIAFYRHPFEIAINTLYLLLLGKLVFNAPVEVLAIALAIEGCLECFHHSNIRFPYKLRKLGYFIQLPDMHLVHHEMGLHRYNYAPFLWDGIFGTALIPSMWEKRLGFKQSDDIRGMFFFKRPA